MMKEQLLESFKIWYEKMLNITVSTQKQIFLKDVLFEIESI